MEPDKRLAQLKKLVDRELVNFMKNFREVVDYNCCHEMYEHLREFVSRGGKRLRPIAVILGFKAVPGFEKVKGNIFRASLSVELIHNSTLIHDDIMDRDELRRGGKTTHAFFRDYFKLMNAEDAGHMGVSMGIIGGDILLALGILALTTSGFESEKVCKAIEILMDTYRKIGDGQIMDMTFPYVDVEEIDMGLYIDMITLKSAILYEASFWIGALLAGASEEQINVLRSYAVDIARAFQIQDDILGMFGDEKETGKPVGNDLREGKRTILVVELLNRCNEEERERVLKILGNKNALDEDIEYVRQLMLKYGVLEDARKLGLEYVGRAKEILLRNADKFNRDVIDILLWFADFMVARRF